MTSPAITNVRTSPPPRVPAEGFALTVVDTRRGCDHCHGPVRLEVRVSEGVAGYLVSMYPWDTDIPDAATEHPATEHYRMDWDAEDVHGTLLAVDTSTLHFAASKIASMARAGNIDIAPVRKGGRS